MAADQTNFQKYLYVDDNGVSWTKRGRDGPASAVDGHATATGAPTWEDSARMKVRRAIYQDPTTFRTFSAIIYTAAAFAAIADGDTVAVHVAGETTTVDYNCIGKQAEKRPKTGPSRQLADHA
jgi:hypothetical protein